MSDSRREIGLKTWVDTNLGGLAAYRTSTTQFKAFSGKNGQLPHGELMILLKTGITVALYFDETVMSN